VRAGSAQGTQQPDAGARGLTPVSPSDKFWFAGSMRRGILISSGILCLSALLAPGQEAAGPPPLSAQRPLLDRYCVTCHNQKLKTGGLTLDKIDLARIGENAETWEKVVRKLRAGMMPPQGLPRPKPAEYEGLTASLENAL